MLPFRLHVLELKGRKVLLLPKLNKEQMNLAEERLTKSGLKASVGKPGSLTFAGGDSAVHLDARGLAWSASDPTDVIAPLIPSLLEVTPEHVSLEEALGMYLKMGSQSDPVIRFDTRVESFAAWDLLRSEDECGLTPDEHSVGVRLLRSYGGECEVLTDFPTDRCSTTRVGRRQYYRSTIVCEDAAESLRVIGRRKERNSYLPRSGAISPKPFRRLSKSDLHEVLADLGEWSSFRLG